MAPLPLLKTKIFVASSDELMPERKKCTDIVDELGKAHSHLNLESVRFEIDLVPGNNPGMDDIQGAINLLLKECQIAVFFFYTKIGKYTRQEFEYASKHNKKIFAYFKKGFSPTLETMEDYMALLKFKKGFQDSLVYVEYENLTEFDSKVYKNLNLHLRREYSNEDRPQALVSSSRQLIPIAPRPHIAHPYSLVKNFTGRAEEMNKLTEWFHLKKEPMLIVEAIGGMGKSALTWKWLHDEIIYKETEVEGIIWWSFYEEPFGTFIKHLFQYVFTEKEREKMGMVDELTELIRALYQRRFLLVLDGFERELRGYAQMMGMYIQEKGLSKKKIEEAFDKLQRDSVHPKAAKFLQKLCGGKTKTLMTTRLFPTTLEDRGGIHHIRLTGLSDTDTIEFFKKEKINGSPNEMVNAGKTYNNHPLMLNLLSSSISRSRTKNIAEAFSKNIIDREEPQKILQTSYQLLNEEERKVARTISVFRTSFEFDAAKALFPKMKEDRLWEILYELRKLGFVFYQEQEEVFDFHPIMRSFLYSGMKRRAAIHERAIVYFQALPKKEKIVSMEDLESVIEQYYHLVRAGKLEEAYHVYVIRLSKQLYFHLGQYVLVIKLLEESFVRNELQLPKLINKRKQSHIANQLSKCYSSLGKLSKANEYLFQNFTLSRLEKKTKNLCQALINIAEFIQFYTGVQTAGIVHLHKAKILTENEESLWHKSIYKNAIGMVFIYQGHCILNSKKEFIQNDALIFLKNSLDYCIKNNFYQAASIVSFSYSMNYLQKIRLQNNKLDFFHEAFKWGFEALKYIETHYRPNIKNYIQSYWTIGHVFLQFSKHKQILPKAKNIVSFYDEHFQKIIEKFSIKQINLVPLSERCLTEALTRSRKINLVEYEPIILLSFAQLEWLKIQDGHKDLKHFPEIEAHLEEAQTIAAKGPYRIYLADIHLFCAETLIEIAEQKLDLPDQLLGDDANAHLKKAKENALDLSTMDDVYQSEDPDFYKGIPEYEMIKRGMTDQERIENGYYVAWQVAERLEGRLASL